MLNRPALCSLLCALGSPPFALSSLVCAVGSVSYTMRSLVCAAASHFQAISGPVARAMDCWDDEEELPCLSLESAHSTPCASPDTPCFPDNLSEDLSDGFSPRNRRCPSPVSQPPGRERPNDLTAGHDRLVKSLEAKRLRKSEKNQRACPTARPRPFLLQPNPT